MSALNPHAPEYKPITPGVSNPQLLSFSHLPPPFSAVHRHLPPPPPPKFYSSQILTYIASSSASPISRPPPFCYSDTSYYFTPQFPKSTNTSPRSRVLGRSERSCSGQNRGFRAGDRNGRVLYLNERNEKRNLGFEREDIIKHEIVPLKRNENNTTIMIRNIPYDCPRGKLISMLDDFCTMENDKNRWRKSGESAYDFFYMPIDFKTGNGRGFAFVNFTNPRTVWKFFNAFHLAKWDFVDWVKWPKKIEIVSAIIQGKKALVHHFSSSHFECETDEFLPVCFNPPRRFSGQPMTLTVVGKRGGRSHRAAPNNHHNEGLKA